MRRQSVLSGLFLLMSLFCGGLHQALAQDAGVPPQVDPRIYDIISAASADRVEADITALAGFGTRNTFSDTLSETRGIGAARRWIKSEFDKISTDCGGCLEVFFHNSVVPASRRRAH